MNDTAEPVKHGILASGWIYVQAAGALVPLLALALTPAWLTSEHFERVVFAYPLVSMIVFVAALILAVRCALVAARLVWLRGDASAYIDWHRSDAAAATRRRRRMKFAAVAGSLLVGLGLAEAAFRVFGLHDPDRVPKGVVFADYDVRLNRLGLREPWDEPPPKDARRRIAVLGDSMVFGLGVAPEQTFAKLLEAELGNWGSGAVTFNVGAPGTAPQVQREKLEELLPVLQPDIVVHVLYPNDLGVELRSLVQRIHDVRAEPFWTGQWSYLLHFVELKIREADIWRDTLTFYRGGLTSAERESAWTRFETDLMACRDTFRAAGAEYVVVLFPWLIELHDYPLIDVHERIRAVVEQMNVPYTDLLTTFGGRDASKFRNSEVDEHPNAAGHQLAAEAIAEFLRSTVTQ